MPRSDDGIGKLSSAGGILPSGEINGGAITEGIHL
jgi:hypothetical protein